MTNVKIANRIAEYREKVSLTQKELAKVIGVNESTIANYERGRTISEWIDRLNKLCIRLNCKLEDLVTYSEQEALQLLRYDLSQTRSSEITLDSFRLLIEDIEISQEFLSPYICFNSNKKFTRKLVFGEGYLVVYVIGWKPGQMTDIHHHAEALSAVRVVQGELTHWFPDGENGEICLEPGEKFKNSETIFVNRHQKHQLGNTSNEDLVTLTFRYGVPPEDNNWVDNFEELTESLKKYPLIPDSLKWETMIKPR